MPFSIGFFIVGTVAWAFDHSYNPAFDYGIGMVLLGLSLSPETPSD